MKVTTTDYPWEVFMLKLVSKETIIADVQKVRGGYKCANPLVIGFILDPHTGLGELHMSKWTPFTEEHIVVSKAHVMGIVAPIKNMVDAYHSHVVRLQMGPTNADMEEVLKEEQERMYEGMLKDFKGPVN